jgi:hypothetical protein
MNPPSKLLKNPRRLTPWKVARAVFIGFALFSAVMLAPVAVIKYNSMQLAMKHAEVAQETVYVDKEGKQITAAEHALDAGYEGARTRKLASHKACAAVFKNIQLLGCQKYVTEHKVFPPHVVQGNWDSGKSTAQCRAEVEAYWNARARDENERGGILSHHQWSKELNDCENYDNVRVAKSVTEPTYRLDAILKRLDAGGHVTDKDRETVRKDTALVLGYPENEQRKAYLYKVERFNLFADQPL